MAGTEHPYNFGARANYVKGKLSQKYRRLVDTPEWGGDEVKELGKNLKSSVKGWEQRRKEVIRRLNWSAVAYLAGKPGAKELLGIEERTKMEPGREREVFHDGLRRVYSGV